MVPDTAQGGPVAMNSIVVSVAARLTMDHPVVAVVQDLADRHMTMRDATASIIAIQATAAGTAKNMPAHMAVTTTASDMAGNIGGTAAMSMPIVTDVDTAVGVDTNTVTTLAPGIMDTTGMSSLIAVDAAAAATNTVTTPVPGITDTTGTSLLIVADPVAAVTNTVTTLDLGIMGTTGMSSLIAAGEVVAVTNMVTTPVPGIMDTTGTSSLIVADVVAAVTNMATTLAPGIMDTTGMSSLIAADAVVADTNMGTTLDLGITDTTGVSSLIAADVAAAATNTVTTLAPGIMGTTGTSSLIVTISDMGRTTRAITARGLLIMADGAAEPAAWATPPVGAAKAPDISNTLLVRPTTRPERKPRLNRGLTGQAVPLLPLVCWSTLTRTKTVN